MGSQDQKYASLYKGAFPMSLPPLDDVRSTAAGSSHILRIVQQESSTVTPKSLSERLVTSGLVNESESRTALKASDPVKAIEDLRVRATKVRTDAQEGQKLGIISGPEFMSLYHSENQYADKAKRPVRYSLLEREQKAQQLRYLSEQMSKGEISLAEAKMQYGPAPQVLKVAVISSPAHTKNAIVRDHALPTPQTILKTDEVKNIPKKIPPQDEAPAVTSSPVKPSNKIVSSVNGVNFIIRARGDVYDLLVPGAEKKDPATHSTATFSPAAQKFTDNVLKVTLQNDEPLGRSLKNHLLVIEFNPDLGFSAGKNPELSDHFARTVLGSIGGKQVPSFTIYLKPSLLQDETKALEIMHRELLAIAAGK